MKAILSLFALSLILIQQVDWDKLNQEQKDFVLKRILEEFFEANDCDKARVFLYQKDGGVALEIKCKYPEA